MTSTLDLKNISVLLAEELRKVGIFTPIHLKRVGAEKAWQRLRASGAQHDPHVLLGLEGAIQGVDWHALPASRRAELVRFAIHE